MDIPRLMSMNAYWAENPPTHLLVKAFMGVKSKPSINSNTSSKKENEDALEQLVLNTQNDPDGINKVKVRMI